MKALDSAIEFGGFVGVVAILVGAGYAVEHVHDKSELRGLFEAVAFYAQLFGVWIVFVIASGCAKVTGAQNNRATAIRHVVIWIGVCAAAGWTLAKWWLFWKVFSMAFPAAVAGVLSGQEDRKQKEKQERIEHARFWKQTP